MQAHKKVNPGVFGFLPSCIREGKPRVLKISLEEIK
jgi:hypothetical protein